MQPDCADYIATVEVVEPPLLEARPLLPGYLMWAAIFTAVIIFELWAIKSGHYTLSEVVWNGPKVFRWLLGGFFAWLMIHLFVQG